MSESYVVCNQLGHYWGKQKKWADGTDPRRVAVFKHRDEALNQLVELSARDIELRAELREVTLNERKVPAVEPSEHLIVEEKPEETPADAADVNAAEAIEPAAQETATADGEETAEDADSARHDDAHPGAENSRQNS